MRSPITATDNNYRKFVENNFMIKAVLIADGSGLMNEIRESLKACCPHMEVIGQANSVQNGVAAINELEPELIFLDTSLSDGSGFDLVRHFERPDFKIIFISSTADYATQAIKFNAIDYLIKPVDIEEITIAVNKAIEMIRREESILKKALGESISNLDKSRRMVLKASDQVHVINMSEIIRIEADRNYSVFHMLNGKQILISKGLKEYEDVLLEHGFHRIHKSHIFNINLMSHLDKIDGGYVVMCDGSRVPVASRKREMLLDLFEEIK
ncbi:MAG: LytTR family DNA-binding domain-containing protein [Bacteroidota bacterium]